MSREPITDPLWREYQGADYIVVGPVTWALFQEIWDVIEATEIGRWDDDGGR